jgi:hypothetical protein
MLRFLADESCDYAVVRADSAGVILIRFPGHARQTMADSIVRLVHEQGEQLVGAFVVLQPDHIRINRKPGAQR